MCDDEVRRDSLLISVSPSVITMIGGGSLVRKISFTTFLLGTVGKPLVEVPLLKG